MEFVKIQGYEGFYEISESGIIRNVQTGKELSWRDNGRGYAMVTLYREGKGKNFKVHRLVAIHFIPNPDNLPEVDHEDKDRWNNHKINLRWSSRAFNMAHRHNKLAEYEN